ncbi:hypothetical protein SFOMI_3329 [Sphingobium fuliginis]|uniref:Uncharacterized protein n=1 Tax=Sphingobium fuliginis (strain ATCC 27551) TaxID=336203 RepID=A0A292ZH49_SPHSA|nr:hypothetical protein SFOMI_3329 [Sphingobium fuliginis]
MCVQRGNDLSFLITIHAFTPLHVRRKIRWTAKTRDESRGIGPKGRDRLARIPQGEQADPDRQGPAGKELFPV